MPRLTALRYDVTLTVSENPRTTKGASAGLTTGRVVAQLLEKGAQRVQFRAKARPVAGFQLLHRVVVMGERLARSIGLGADERGLGWRARGRGGSLEERGQRPGERLVHDDTVAIGHDHPLELRQLSCLGTEIE